MLLANETSGVSSQLTLLLPLLLIAGMMFLMFRSRKKQMAQQAAMVSSLSPGTRVLLGSGFFGTVLSVEGEQAEVEIAPGVVTTVVTRSILRIERDSQPQTPGDDLIGRDEPPTPGNDER